MSRRKDRHRDYGRAPSTASRLTRVRDPRAAVRFTLDERVYWNEGDRKLTGAIVGFEDDECMARVRLDVDGSIVLWPTMSARMKRIPTSSFGDDMTVPDSIRKSEDERYMPTLKDVETINKEKVDVAGSFRQVHRGTLYQPG